MTASRGDNPVSGQEARRPECRCAGDCERHGGCFAVGAAAADTDAQAQEAAETIRALAGQIPFVERALDRLLAALTAVTTCNCLVRESVDRCPVHLPAAYKTTRAALTAAERERDRATENLVVVWDRAEYAERALVEEREAHRHTKRLLEASEAQNASDAGGKS